jgi:EAL domain-containing protein (putative c-di-GMP-specific phosphodiesterase class I)
VPAATSDPSDDRFPHLTMGCRFGQGFFYHRPMDGDAIVGVAQASASR